MSPADIAASALLALSILGVLAACVGAWRSATSLDGQHFVSAAATVPPVLLAAAVIVREGIGSSAAVLTILTVAVVVLTGAATTAAFGRAADGEPGGPEQAGEDIDGTGS